MHRSRPRAALFATLVAVALALAACGSSAATAAPTAAPASAPASTAPSPAASSGAGGGTVVTIKDFAFAPATLEVPVGATVEWTNQDSAGHTVTADDGSFDSKTLSSGQGFSFAFPTAGTFAYHCNIHKSMTATITVK